VFVPIDPNTCASPGRGVNIRGKKVKTFEEDSMTTARRALLVAIPFALLVFADASQADPKAPWDGTWTGSWGDASNVQKLHDPMLSKSISDQHSFFKLCANEILAVDLFLCTNDDFHAALRGHYDHPIAIADDEVMMSDGHSA
jgi:hypothetical protein